MSHEDDTPTRLESQGWETLPDGRQQLKLTCNTIVDYATMPKSLLLGKLTVFKVGWDEEKKIAFYRAGGVEDLMGEIQ